MRTSISKCNKVWLRRTILLFWDIMCWIVAAFIVAMLRFKFELAIVDWWSVYVFVALAAVTYVGGGLTLKTHRNRYRVSSFEETLAISSLTITSAVLAAMVSIIVPVVNAIPPTLAVAIGLLALLLSLTGRFVYRASMQWTRPNNGYQEPVLVIGAGNAGYQLARQIQGDYNSTMKIVGFIDDSYSKQNLRIMGIPVLGTRKDIADIVKERDIKTIIFAIATATTEVMREFSDICDSCQTTMMTVPPISQIVGGKISLEDLRQINVEDILGRRQVSTNISEIAQYINGKRVLITGAGGSIGAEICRQVHRHGPKSLIMMDRDESALHSIQLDIYHKGLLDTPDMVLCDIRDKDALEHIFMRHHPQVIFHAAALKHLPMLEQYPEEGWKTNVLGTCNLLELANKYDTKTFVNISTDKAAEATSVLGRTKRLAEQLTSHFGDKSAGVFLSVRFGNVLGSRGSVLWAFRKQIEGGGPVTITHPDVERYFMTIPEACALVIQAGAIGRSGEVLILDMGDPVKIVDVARRMIAKHGAPVEIVYSGLRCGEKLTEVLVDQGEQAQRPFHPLITHAKVNPLDPSGLESLHEETVVSVMDARVGGGE